MWDGSTVVLVTIFAERLRDGANGIVIFNKTWIFITPILVLGVPYNNLNWCFQQHSNFLFDLFKVGTNFKVRTYLRMSSKITIINT